MTTHLRCITVAAGLAALAGPTAAQCPNQWTALGKGIGTWGAVHWLGPWDLDSAGPQPAQLCEGGTSIGAFKTWNGTTWGQPTFGSTAALVLAGLAANGTMYLGGVFHANGTNGVRVQVSYRDGAEWRYIPGLLEAPNSASIHALSWMNDSLHAAGYFVLGSGFTVNNIARWDGAAWRPLGSGVGGLVAALRVYQGEMIAAGAFGDAGGVPAARIAAWDGAAWHPLGLGMNGDVLALTEFQGELIAGGAFTTAGGNAALRVGAWNGQNWRPLAAGVGGTVYSAIHALSAHRGELIAGGLFESSAGAPLSNLARYSGVAWQDFAGGTDGLVRALCSHGGQLFVGGEFEHAGPVEAHAIAALGCPCAPDCDGDGLLTLADFGCFQARFALQDAYADCDKDVMLTLADFGCFQARFALGCP